MKKRAVQVVLSMVVLVVVTAVFMADSVQAKEAGWIEVTSRAVNEEHILKFVEEWTEYEEANSTFHFVYTCKKYVCDSHPYCDAEEVIFRSQTGYERHDLSGFAPSPHTYRCVLCGYEE